MWTLKELGELLSKKVSTFPLALPTLAALTPDHYDIVLVDEEMEPIPAGIRPDIVGITSLATNTRGAYRIADSYRAEGIPVVMGGPSTSLNADDSLAHADSVCIGEAETVWHEILKDFERGTLGRIYRPTLQIDFKTGVKPRWDLVNKKDVLAYNVQASRGCPCNCNFCCVPTMFGTRQRYRDVDDVVEEIKGLPSKQVSFVDDNMITDRTFVRELTSKLKPLGITWSCLAGLQISKDRQLLSDMADAGCTSIVIGFESLDPADIDKVRSKDAAGAESRYAAAIQAVHEAGIHVIGAFIFGFDTDTMETFDRVLAFAERNNLSYVMLNILTAFPGTPLHRTMAEAKRTVDLAPQFLNGIVPTIRYAHLKPADILHGYFDSLEKLYSFEHLHKRAVALFSAGHFRRKRKGGISLLGKLKAVYIVLTRFVFTSDRPRKRIMKDLFKLGREKTASMDCIFEYILFMEAANVYIQRYKAREPELLSEVNRAFAPSQTDALDRRADNETSR
jgi:hypothetical protein